MPRFTLSSLSKFLDEEKFGEMCYDTGGTLEEMVDLEQRRVIVCDIPKPLEFDRFARWLEHQEVKPSDLTIYVGQHVFKHNGFEYRLSQIIANDRNKEAWAINER